MTDQMPERPAVAREPAATEAAGTGDAAVDQALTRLDELDHLPITEHATVVEGVHRALQDRLAEGQE